MSPQKPVSSSGGRSPAELLAEPSPAMDAPAAPEPRVVAHVVGHDAVERRFRELAQEVAPVHLEEVGVVVAEQLGLVRRRIGRLPGAHVDLAKVVEPEPVVPGRRRGERVGVDGDVVALPRVVELQLLA